MTNFTDELARVSAERDGLHTKLLHQQHDHAQAVAALSAIHETAEADRDHWKHRAEVAEQADREHGNQLMAQIAETDKLRDVLASFPGFCCGMVAGDDWIERKRAALAKEA